MPCAAKPPPEVMRILSRNLPDGFRVNISDSGALTICDGIGPRARYAVIEHLDELLLHRDGAAYIARLDRLITSAMFALCEYPERYASA